MTRCQANSPLSLTEGSPNLLLGLRKPNQCHFIEEMTCSFRSENLSALMRDKGPRRLSRASSRQAMRWHNNTGPRRLPITYIPSQASINEFGRAQRQFVLSSFIRFRART